MREHDDVERREWQDPEAILLSLGLKPGEVVADVGSGDGFFTLPAARMVGPRGWSGRAGLCTRSIPRSTG